MSSKRLTVPCRRFIVGLVIGILCRPSAAWAILIDAGGVKVGGYLVRDDGRKLVVRVRTPEGQEKVTEYDRTKTKINILHQYDKKLLESLSRTNPKGYLDYALKLAAQEGDPEARYMAMRLFLIAAYLEPRQFGHDCLLSMSRLASTPAEARRCRAMAFLLDARRDASLLKAEIVKPVEKPKITGSTLQDYLKALQEFRAGQIPAARTAAARDGVDKVFSQAPGGIDKKVFLEMCKGATCATCGAKKKVTCPACNGRPGLGRCPVCNGKTRITCPDCDGTGFNPTLPDEVLRVIVRAELWAMDQLTGGAGRGKDGQRPTSWSALLQERQVHPVSILSLETITDIDPRRCHYRNGEWVAPQPAKE
jgi:hypothetical protein